MGHPESSCVQEDSLADARILILDDEEENVRFLERMLHRDGYRNVWGSTNPLHTLEALIGGRFDILLLDLNMPEVSGFELLRQLKSIQSASEFLPVLVLTGDTALETRQRALSAGAHDFVAKPFDLLEVRLRIRNLLRIRWLHRKLEAQNAELEERVSQRTALLEQSRSEALEKLARAAEYRDDVTGQHTRRVGEISRRIALALGLHESDAGLLSKAAPLHDVGKIGIPDSILLKPGPLTTGEFQLMKTHTTIGAMILSGSDSPVFALAEQIALAHHEHWNGGGYPNGSSGESIPISARIVAVADVFDALTHARPYKSATGPEEARRIVREQKECQFDPAVVDAFEHVLDALP